MSDASDANASDAKVSSPQSLEQDASPTRSGAPRVVSARVHEHPAVRAWTSLAGENEIPAHVELLRTRKKSVVYRIPGVGARKTDVIAKKCRLEGARLEGTIYDALSTANLEMPVYYGLVEDPGDDWGWLFIEDAAGEPYDPENELHRSTAARWLAALHTAPTLGVGELPERRDGYYHEHLERARHTVSEQRSRLTLDAASRHMLDAALRMCDAIEARWPLIRDVCATTPGALVHNDFSRFNVRVRTQGHALRLYAFDWELAGWGLPTLDLLIADASEYWQHTRSHWPALDYATLERGLWVAELLRNTAAVHWEATHLHQEKIQWPLNNVSLYLQRMTVAQRRLGWWARFPG